MRNTSSGHTGVTELTYVQLNFHETVWRIFFREITLEETKD